MTLSGSLAGSLAGSLSGSLAGDGAGVASIAGDALGLWFRADTYTGSGNVASATSLGLPATLVQADDGLRPTIAAGPSWLFTKSSNQSLADAAITSDVMPINTFHSVFFVGTVVTAVSAFFDFTVGGSHGSGGPSIFRGSTTINLRWITSAGTLTASGSAPSSGLHLFEGTLLSTGAYLYVDGALSASSLSANTGNNATVNHLSFGKLGGTFSYYTLDGTMREMVHLKAPTVAQRTAMTDFLMAKYGL